MIDKSQNRTDVLEMRKLFWDWIADKINHKQLIEKLSRINNKQMFLSLDKNILKCYNTKNEKMWA